ncbi:AAA family ATPase [Altererythrobacter litoralis]|uniref:AAA family ATPase n=1 Tax=Altererythrobacter litoralis TaxID=3113904 RepID=A0ABU7GCJ8_9SPHN|nr:AAA family ATPase [Erythrobacteraceae bacterium 1XM1-14]
MIEPDSDMARSFFAETISDQIHLVAIIPDGATIGRSFGIDIETAIAWATAQNGQGKNVYWTVNGVRAGVNKKPTKADITHARFVHVDIDPPKDGSAWDRNKALADLQGLASQPSLVIDSGNGLQAFWRLDGQAYTQEQVEAVNVAIRDHFGADKCHNIDRLMRVPGFVNYPNKKKRDAGRVPALASWVQEDSGEAFTLDQIAAALPTDTPFEEAANSAPQLPAGLHTLAMAPKGQDRSDDAFAFACAAIRERWSDAQITNILLDARYTVSAHCLDQDDPQRAAQRAIDNARKAEGGQRDSQETTKPAFHFTPVGQLQYCAPEFLIDGLIETDSLGLIFGDPGCGKSFLAIDLGMSVATGEEFHGRAVKQGPVFFIAGEGHNGLTRRMAAWAKDRGIESLRDIPLFKSNRAAQLLDADSAAQVTEAVAGLAEQCGNPALIIIDTLARNFGSGDENSTKDMSEFVAAVDEMKAHFSGCTVLIVHHTGHAEKGRARGAMALKGALDCEYMVVKKRTRVHLSNTKMKDAEPPRPMVFELKTVELGEDVSSAVLESTDAPEEQDGLTPTQRLARNAFIDAAAHSGTDNGDGSIAVHLEDWRKEFYAQHTGDSPDTKRKAFGRLRDKLQQLGLVTVENDFYVWRDATIALEIDCQRTSLVNGGTAGHVADI